MRAEIRLQYLFGNQVYSATRLFKTHSRLESGNESEIPEGPIIEPLPIWGQFHSHCERDPDVRRLTDHRTEKALGGDADDGIDGRSDGDGLADCVWIAVESTLPPGVARDRHRMAAGNLVVRVRKSTAE